MAFEHSEQSMTVYCMRDTRGEITVGGHDLYLFCHKRLLICSILPLAIVLPNCIAQVFREAGLVKKEKYNVLDLCRCGTQNDEIRLCPSESTLHMILSITPR